MEEPAKSLVEHIKALEEALLDNDVRQSAGQLEALLSGCFFEFGSSGRVYRYRPGDTYPPVSGYEISDFTVITLSTDCVLATYTIALQSGQDVKRSLRSSIWQFFDGQWKIVFHQGTPQP